jgi:hypothetical protein
VGDCGGYEYEPDEVGTVGLNGEPDWKPSRGYLGDEVGRLNASSVEEMAVLPEVRVFFVLEKRSVNQLIAVFSCEGDGTRECGLVVVVVVFRSPRQGCWSGRSREADRRTAGFSRNGRA